MTLLKYFLQALVLMLPHRVLPKDKGLAYMATFALFTLGYGVHWITVQGQTPVVGLRYVLLTAVFAVVPARMGLPVMMLYFMTDVLWFFTGIHVQTYENIAACVYVLRTIYLDYIKPKKGTTNDK